MQSSHPVVAVEVDGRAHSEARRAGPLQSRPNEQLFSTISRGAVAVVPPTYHASVWKRVGRFKLSTASAEWVVAGTIVGIVIGLASSAAWVFRARPHLQRASSVWSELLGDRVTLGLIRLLLAAAALYALVSIGVLASRRRWVRSISTTGYRGGCRNELRRRDRRSREKLAAGCCTA